MDYAVGRLRREKIGRKEGKRGREGERMKRRERKWIDGKKKGNFSLIETGGEGSTSMLV